MQDFYKKLNAELNSFSRPTTGVRDAVLALSQHLTVVDQRLASTAGKTEQGARSHPAAAGTNRMRREKVYLRPPRNKRSNAERAESYVSLIHILS